MVAALFFCVLPVLALLRAKDAAGAVGRWHNRLDQLEREAESLRQHARAAAQARR